MFPIGAGVLVAHMHDARVFSNCARRIFQYTPGAIMPATRAIHAFHSRARPVIAQMSQDEILAAPNAR